MLFLNEGEESKGAWFFIRSGYFFNDSQWDTFTYEKRGPDGLIEATYIGYEPTGNPSGVWMSFHLRLWRCRFRLRIRSYSKPNFIWGFTYGK